MKVFRSARIAFLFLVALLFQTDRLVAFAATVPSGACLYALDSTASRAFQIAGAQSVYTACGVVSESSASDGFEMEGAETLYLQNHAQVSVVGGAQLNGQTYLWDTINNKQVQAVKVSSPGDPLASIVAPTSGTIISKSHAYFDMNAKPANNTLSPGVYCGGLTIGNTNGTAFTMNPGVYIMAGGGFVLNSQAVVKGTGVTVYNTSSAGWGCSSSYSYTPVTISGQVTATLSAPTSGALGGILFFGNRTGCSTKGSCVDQINGGSTTVLNGALYFASDEIEITGSNASGYMMLVADKIYINGISTFGNNGDPLDKITVSVSPSTATLYAGQTQQFSATVNNSANSAVTWTISPAGAGSISSSGLYTAPSSVTVARTVTVTATSQADTGKLATATVNLAVKTTPVITWATPAAITYGTALSATQLDATASVAGTFAYSPAAGSLLTAGIHTLSVTFTPTNTTSCNSATARVTLTVNKATPTITWTTPAAITYGTALSAAQLDATASVAGTLTYTPAAGTVLLAGSQPLSVTFTPTDTIDYTTAAGSIGISVNKAALTVTASSASVSYGTAVPTITPSYSGFVNGDSAASLTTVPTCSTTYTVGSAPGAYPTTCSGTVSENYSIGYMAGTVTVTAGNQTISFTPPVTPVNYGVSPITLSASASSGLAVTFSVLSGPATVSGNTLTITGPGTVVVAADQTGNADYSAVAEVTQTIVVNIAPSFTELASSLKPSTYGQNVTFGALVSTGGVSPTGSVSFTDNGTEINSTTIAPVQTTNLVAYSQANAAAWISDETGSAAPIVSADSGLDPFGGTNALQMAFPAPGAGTSDSFNTVNVSGAFAGQTFTASVWLSAPSAAPLNLLFNEVGGSSASASNAVTVGTAWQRYFVNLLIPAADSGASSLNLLLVNPSGQPATTINVFGAQVEAATSEGPYVATYGTAQSGYGAIASFATSTLTPGSHPITAAYGGDVNDAASTSATLTQVVNDATPTLSLAASANPTVYGTPVTLTASISNGLTGTVTFDDGSTEIGSSTLSGGSATLTTNALTAGSHTVTAAWAGNADYNPATSSSITLIVNQTTPTIAWATPAAITYGTALSAAQLNATASVPGTFVYSPAAGTVLPSGAQTLSVTFTPTDTIDYPTATATVTLTVSLPVSVSVTPSSATLYGGQTQQFTASVSNTSDTTVIWTITPAGNGTIDSAGLYTTPATISTQQTVTVTATSLADSTKSASATVTLSLAQCGSNGYSYQRAIVIDHTKVPNTDQTNFPFLFNTTDPLLVTTANGGHVTSSNGYDIIFTSDAAGQNKLDYEMEEYNPATGQVIAWVRIPTLSHSTDTVIYVFYGNSSITASQQNPTGVWDSNYLGVWHLPNGTTLSANDSTSNGHNGTLGSSTTATAGQIGGGAKVSTPNSGAIDIPAYSSVTFSAATFSAWVEMSQANSWAGIIYSRDASDPIGMDINGSGQLSYTWNNGSSNTYDWDSGLKLPTGLWAYTAISITSSGATAYVCQSGSCSSSSQSLTENPQISSTDWYLGSDQYSPSTRYWGGSIDEARISNIARSTDWIAAEYNNQSSPSTFSKLYSEEVETVVPTAVTLYRSQFQQFVVPSACSSYAAIWSMPSGAPGTLSASGLYTAPASIESQQTVAITATTLGASSTSLSATVTLMPPVSVSVTPPSVTLSTGQSQQFIASVSNTNNPAVTWTINPIGAGTISALGLYTAPVSVTTQQTVYITATSQADTSQSASAAITIAGAVPLPAVSISVTPANVTLYSAQTQQFTASVTNTYNTTVTWSISPAGFGTVSESGLYTAPATITATQTVTITVTSQENPIQSASASIALSPTSCGSSGYNYVRTIAIDHTKVPNTDQIDFPFLFNTTDPTFSTTANGGHVANSSGNDIIFSTDPNGTTMLDYELEQYNPITGQIVAWIRIPNLSHTSDTVLYVLYGNSSITSSQQNPTGVWDSNYGGVWHLSGSGTPQPYPDSTINANTAAVVGSASATSGPIGNAVALNGNTNYIDAGNQPSVLPTHTGTFSTWVKYNVFCDNCYNTVIGNGNTWSGINGTVLWNYGESLHFDVNGASVRSEATYSTFGKNQWYYLTGTWDGSTVALYVNGTLASSTKQITDASPAYDLTLGIDGAKSFDDGYLNGSLEEARVSSIARSADWIGTEYSNQISPSSFYALSTENEFYASPVAVTLNASQSQQFTATASCTAGTTWSMPAGSPGTLTSNGLYTAPGIISAQQTVVITATNQTTTTRIAAVIVTLMPPVAISVVPGSVTLTSDQTQQFTASVANTSNTAITWTVTPAGVGAVDASGVYTAPSTISVQQTVTITATSLDDTTKSASAIITLNPTQCASSGYAYQRVIVIDHTKVPNTDQTNFPFLFNTTDSDLATDDNGGHVTSLYGYDIIFSTDPNGLTKLDHEMEKYDPLTGQVIAWVRIPTLSHTTDTVIYVFYGNPNITSTQQNPTGVWDSNYTGVYHLAGLSASTVADSTASSNNGTLALTTTVSGEIGDAVNLNGTSSYIQIPESDFPDFPTGVYNNVGLLGTDTENSFATSFEGWFKTASAGGILGQTTSQTCTFNVFGYCVTDGPIEPGNSPDGSWDTLIYVDDNGLLRANGLVSTSAYNDNSWHFAAWTAAISGSQALYVDGQQVASGNHTWGGYASDYAYFVGTAYTDQDYEGNWNWLYFNGNIDEIAVSKSARSGDWIQAEYNNQGSPSTFYKFYPRSTVEVVPSVVSLYALQNQQFAVSGSCNSAVAWTMSSEAQGTLTSGGLYTAPGNITGQQSIAITASSPVSGETIGAAVVTLLPQPSPIALVASAQSPYTVGSSQTLAATLLDQDGTPESGVGVTFTVTGANGNIGSGTTGTSGVASYTYTGANSGSDTIQATAVINGQALRSNSVSVSWLIPAAQNPAAAITLMPPPSVGIIGLVGAFTDSNGAVIEPIAIGATARVYAVPAGATQLQMGVDSAYFVSDGGPGFVVAVNGVSVTIPPTSMPWTWVAGGLNNNYQYGIYVPSIQNGILDGTSPVVAATDLTQGESVSISYQSGTASANPSVRSLVNADGDQTWLTGVGMWQGTYFPTLYMTTSSYPVGQFITLNALVTDASETPIPNLSVTLNIAGANVQQLQAVTDSTGMATFMYRGLNSGIDTLQAQADTSGGATLSSNESSITWTPYATPSAAGALNLEMLAKLEQRQLYDVVATDATGSPAFDTNIGAFVWGIDNFQSSGQTDVTGQYSFNYWHTNAGTYNVVAVKTVNRNVIFSNVINGVWTPSATTSACNDCNIVTVSISAQSTVTLPNTLQLNGTVTDSEGITPTIAWSQVSGPGTVTFATPQQAVTTATFKEPGTYVVQLSANDTSNSASAQFTVTVESAQEAGASQGWVGSPLYGSTVSGVVPITLAPGITLQSGVLTFLPTNNSNSVTTLNANTTGSGQIGTLDTTTLQNGTYWIQLQATDTSGNQQYALVLVTVTGSYKPGRVMATVTDLVVPSTGLSINIQRSYDSLNASTSGDFGYGWNLGINVNLVVDPKGDVTFTLGGQRKTFYLSPKPATGGCIELGCLPNILGFDLPAYTAEPGLHGTLSDGGTGCFIDWIVPDDNVWTCVGGYGTYNPTSYIYTDPNGTSYTISAAGNLKSIQDRSSNGLTITTNGITSTTGLNVPFVRDAKNRITQITDPQGNIYSYGYDDNGNLASVTYPNTTQPSTYTYDSNHLYLTGTDARSNPLPVTTYYTSTETDASGNSLNGRLQSVTDALGNTTSYVYDLATTTTTVTYSDNGKATMVYNSYGDLLTSTDPLGNMTTNVYDASHNLTSVTDPLGHKTAYTYDANGNKTSTTYPATGTSTNTTSSTAYNQYSEPTSTTDELGNIRTFNYDANYNPQSVTDSAGTLASFIFNSNSTLAAGAIGYDISTSPALASQFTYDTNGNMASRTDALGRTTTYTYDSLGHKIAMATPTPTTLTGGSASTTTYQYDALGNLTETAAPLGRTTSSQYDANGNKLYDIDALGNKTSYAYDALNRLITTTYPDGTTATKSYDFRNNVIDEKDQAGNITHHAYDQAGRQTSVTRGYGAGNASTTSYDYDDAGRKTSETDALNHTTSYSYDAAGHLIAVSGVKGNTIYAYDNAGNQVSRTDGNSNTTNSQYDVRKRLIKTINPDGTTVVNTYDGPGNLASVTDQANNVVQYTYDAANQLKTVVQVNHPTPSNNTNLYGYDSLGNLIGLTDENLHTTQNSFDLLNEPVSKVLPDQAHTETRKYDAAGNLVSLTHFNGVTTTYTYDALNRLLSRTTPGESTVSFTYTPTGKYLTSTAADGTVDYTYDALDRLITKATPEGTLSYTYDAAGHVESIVSSNTNGVSVSYSYDDLNRLSAVVDNRLPGQNTTSYTYDNASNVATATYPNGLQSSFTYDSLNRLTSLVTPVSGYTYQLGPTGNRTEAVEVNHNRVVSWNYDGIYRLTGETISSSESEKSGAVSYSLDPVGNRLSDSSTLSGINSGSFTYNANDEQVSSETYDANGNTLSTGGKSFTYDSENHLTSMTSGSTVVKIVYDAFGNRVAKTVNGVTTKYLVEDDVNPTGLPQVLEETVNGVVQREYTYGLQRISQYQSIDGAWTASFYGYDGAGSVRQLTNTAGVVTDEYEYDAFGNSFTKTGTTPNVYLYRGEQYDADLGLHYLRARYYNPKTGRFVSMDPEDGIATDPVTLHKYDYAGGDPVNMVDPTGREAMFGFLMVSSVALEARQSVAALGAEINCMYEWISTKFTAAINTGMRGGTIKQVNQCQWLWKPAEVAPFNTWVTQQTNKAHGPLWHYGNWCGPGGAGTPVDALDAACQRHDYCYAAGGFTASSNYMNLSSDEGAALQACNQALCDSADAIIQSGQGPSRDAWSVVDYFGGLLPPLGGQYACH